jgi:hypothetical protein
MNSANDNNPDDKARFCATCGSAYLTASELAGGEASCTVCGWKGRVEDLATFRFSHGMGSQEEVFRLFFLDIRKLLSKQFAQDAGVMLIKWGFIDAPDKKNVAAVQQKFARYIAVIAKSIAEGVVRTRADIEKETHRDQPSA